MKCSSLDFKDSMNNSYLDFGGQGRPFKGHLVSLVKVDCLSPSLALFINRPPIVFPFFVLNVIVLIKRVIVFLIFRELVCGCLVRSLLPSVKLQERRRILLFLVVLES